MEERLVFWDMLLRGEEIVLEKARALAIKTSTDASDEEKAAWALLLAAVEISQAGSLSARCYLRAYLRYYFSQEGTYYRPPDFAPEALDRAGLDEIVGTHLTWEEAVAPCTGKRGGKSVDYSAKQRIEAKLKEACRRWWEALFGSPPKVLLGGEE